jgi:protein SCO1/2
MRRLRFFLWALVATALIAFVAIRLHRETAAEQAAQRAAPSVTFGGPFTLTGANGKSFASSQLAGKPYAIFFGFTHCPDVCPTTLARLVRLREQVKGEDSFAIVFVTVDPERDGPAEMRDYVDLFNSPVIGLTGSPAQIERVKKQFGIFSEKQPGAGGDYSVDHTATTLLFDRAGKFESTISPDEPDSTAVDKLTRLTSNS